MYIKKYLPVENYVLTSSLSVDEVTRRITENIEPKKFFRFSVFDRKPTKPYEGKISGGIFIISRIISYRNSFLPVITGRIVAIDGVTKIFISMRPEIFVIIFMSFWLGIVGLVCLGILVAGLLQFSMILKNGFSPFHFIPFGMFLFGYLLITFGFKGEIGGSKAFLERLLEAKESR